MTKRHPIIVSTGSYVPERVVTNEEVDALLGESTAQWLVENVGIRERRWMTEGQTTSDLIVEACRRALDKAGVRPEEVDLLIVSTDTPDYLSPSTAVVVQHKLGAVHAGCYDVNSACAGWVTALDQGARYLMTEPGMRYVLVAGGYGMSRFLNLKDKYTANLFADGAGAALLTVGEEPGFLATTLKAMGEFHDALGIYTDDVSLFLFTQLNLRTIEAVMARLGQPMSKTHWVMDKWGYTGSPCVVMALDDAIQQGKGPRPGDVVLFCTSGGGISFAVSVWRWTQ